ncbi:MAG: hypothetical protein U0176_22990 [Bacteroidia bacterium]
MRGNGRKTVVDRLQVRGNHSGATLPDLTQMESITYVNEVDIQKIKVGQEVRVSLMQAQTKNSQARSPMSPTLANSVRTPDSKVFEVKIAINEKDSTLRPAMTTSNEIITATFENVLGYIPLEAVHVANDSIPYVFKRNGSSATRQEVVGC